MNPSPQSAIIVTDRQNVQTAIGDRPELEEILVEEDLLVEEVSIDGMCGVY